MNQKFMYCVFAVLFVGMGAGCLHSPIPGATRGVVEIRNEHLFNDPELNKGDAILTGLVIGEHKVLTAAHAFGYDPEPGHPFKIGGERIEYSVVIDGWAGGREEDWFFNLVPGAIQSDFLVLKTQAALGDFVSYVPLTKDRILEFRRATLATRRHDTGEPVAIPLRDMLAPEGNEYFLAGLSTADMDGHYLSGSPVIAEYPDGTRVLIGIATASGDVTVTRENGSEQVLKDQLFITPAYRIPFAELAE